MTMYLHFYINDILLRGKMTKMTKVKNKVQKRYLLDTMKNLYKAFKQENPDVDALISILPWYIKSPSIHGRKKYAGVKYTQTRY